MEYLNDASLLALGCGNGTIKILSVAQSNEILIVLDNVQFILKS